MIKVLENIWASLRNLKSGGFTSIVNLTGVQIGATSAAYASGRTIGTTSPIEVELVRGDYGTGIIQSVVLQDLSAQNAATDVIIFGERPSATTFTNNVALDIADADLPKIIGIVKIAATDYSAFADNSVAVVSNLGIPIKNQSGSNKVWVAFVSRGTPTYVANELSAVFGVLQD